MLTKLRIRMWKVFFFLFRCSFIVTFCQNVNTNMWCLNCDKIHFSTFLPEGYEFCWLLCSVTIGEAHLWSHPLPSPILKGRNAFVWQWQGECMDKHGLSYSEPQKRSLICAELNFDLLVLTHLPWALQRWVWFFCLFSAWSMWVTRLLYFQD